MKRCNIWGDVALGAGILIPVSFICYRSFWPCLAGVVFLPWFIRLRKELRQKNHQKKICREFKDVMTMLFSSVAAGNSIEKSFQDVLKEMQTSEKQYEIFQPEFERIVHGMQQNIPFGRLLEGMSEHVAHEEVTDFVNIILIAGKSGGSMPEVIGRTMETISLRMEMNEEIENIITGKRGEFQIMLVVPAAIMLYMNLFSPEYMLVLYQTPAGRVIMTGALIAYLAAYRIGQKILDIRI